MKKLLIFFFLISAIKALPQVIFTPHDDNIYSFLERLSLKKVIEFHNEVLPKSRTEIAELLLKASEKKEFLNNLEKEELDWYKEEYAYEIGSAEERWYLFKYSDSLFQLRVSPIAGYEISSFGNESGHSRWWGGRFFGTYSNWFGASLDARDKGEFGGNADRRKLFSPQTGTAAVSAPNGFEYSDVKGSITFNLPENLGYISLVKDYLMWGHGKFGQIILSDKAPSFPHIRLSLQPVSWFRFNYIHGWLNSLVFDSSAFSVNHLDSQQPYQRREYINKYIAANFISVTPFDWIDISIGNSIIYSGSLRAEFFIPFMFFKYLDRDTGHGSVEDGNGQLYFDIAVRYPEKFFFYSTLFVDVTEIRNIIDGDFYNTWVGYTFGVKKTDIFLPNFDLIFEYTRINPWVYEHKDETTTYKHVDYDLGHWLGQNAYQLRLQFDYRLLRGLRFSLFSEWIRKGGLKDIYFAYKDNEKEPFLYSPVRKDFRIVFESSYELIHDLFGKFIYNYSEISDEDDIRTLDFMRGSNHYLSFSIFYGL